MKMKSILYVGVFLFAFSLCYAESNVNSHAFPEVGKRYQIEFVSVQQIGSEMAQNGVSLPSGIAIKVLARGEHEWCLVEYLRMIGTDKKTQKPICVKEQYWLNFGVLISAREVEPTREDGVIIKP